MANRHFIPKSISSNSKVSNFNISENSGPQTTSRFRPKVETYSMPISKKYEEKMLTLKRNHDGETEIQFPIGNTKFIQDTQKLFNKYFSNEDECNTDTQSFEQLSDIKPSVSKNPDTTKRFKSVPSILTKNSSSNAVVKSTDSGMKEKATFKKDLLKENIQTEDIVDRKMIHLIGYVEHVIKWDMILKNAKISVMYNVLGTFVNSIKGCWAMEKCIFIKGNNGTVLECSFFEIDRQCPEISRGQFVGCLGQIIGIQKLRLYDIKILENSEKDHTQRAIFLSQRMTEVLNNRKSFA